MLLVVEGVMFLAGIVFLFQAKIHLFGREILGRRAQQLGALLMSPPVIFLPIGLFLGTQVDPGVDDLESIMARFGALALLEFITVIAVLVIFGIFLYNAPRFAQGVKKVAPLKAILTVPEAAEYLSVTPEEIQRMIDAGQIPAGRFGNDYRIARDVLDEYVRPVES